MKDVIGEEKDSSREAVGEVVSGVEERRVHLRTHSTEYMQYVQYVQYRQYMQYMHL
jgi:hypothetical protein